MNTLKQTKTAHLPSAFIIITLRDAEKNFANLAATLNHLKNSFDIKSGVVVENDSSDDTKALSDLLRPRIHRFSLDGLKSIAQRTLRLEICRNFGRRLFLDAYKLEPFDFCILIDAIDSSDVIGLLGIESIPNLFESEPKLGGVLPNQLGGYYDLWALRPFAPHCRSDILKDDLWHDYFLLTKSNEWLSQSQDRRNAITEQYFKTKQLSISSDAPPTLVDSAFGGLAIYRGEAYARSPFPYLGHVVSTRQHGEELRFYRFQVCEHVHFNFGLRALGYQLKICPSLINMKIDNLTFYPEAAEGMVF